MGDNRTKLGAAVVVMVALTVYALTVAPGLTWAHDGADGGDLAVAVANLGVPHPPGYPTYVMLGRLAMVLLPFRDVAFRLNLFSAMCAVSAALTVYLLLAQSLGAREASRSRGQEIVIAVCGALVLAFSPTFWSQAIITEVYTLNAAFVALALLLASYARHGALRVEKALPLLALAFGLGLGNHSTLVLLLPSVLLFVWPRHHEIGTKTVAMAALAFLAGLSVYLYLPLSASRMPTPNWGNPVTPQGFCWMVSASAYRPYAFGLPLSYVPARLSAWAGSLLTQFGIWGVLLGLTGLWHLTDRDGGQALAEGMAFGLCSVYAIGYNTSDSYVYLIPAYLVFTLWIGRGLHHLLSLAQEREGHVSRLSRLAPALVALLPLIPLIANYRSLDLSGDVQAARYGTEIMLQLPAQATVISATDAHTFSLWYAREVSQPRPDVVVLDQDLLQYPWYVENVKRRHPGVCLPGDEHDLCDLLDNLVGDTSGGGPVYLTDPGEDFCERYQLSSEGLLHRVRLAGPA